MKERKNEEKEGRKEGKGGKEERKERDTSFRKEVQGKQRFMSSLLLIFWNNDLTHRKRSIAELYPNVESFCVFC